MQCIETIRGEWHVASRSVAAGIVLCAASFAPLLLGQVSSYGDKQAGQTNDKTPGLLDRGGIAQRWNEQLPLNLAFNDDEGKAVHLSQYFGKKPAILALVYFRCP